MENKLRKNTKGEMLVKRIPSPDHEDVFGEIWQGNTQGDPVIRYHCYRVVRDYRIGRRVIVTHKMLPEHEQARKSVGELAARECLKLDGKAAA